MDRTSRWTDRKAFSPATGPTSITAPQRLPTAAGSLAAPHRPKPSPPQGMPRAGQRRSPPTTRHATARDEALARRNPSEHQQEHRSASGMDERPARHRCRRVQGVTRDGSAASRVSAIAVHAPSAAPAAVRGGPGRSDASARWRAARRSGKARTPGRASGTGPWFPAAGHSLPEAEPRSGRPQPRSGLAHQRPIDLAKLFPHGYLMKRNVHQCSGL